jgi:transcriptional regulator with XRE-family HTH domain
MARPKKSTVTPRMMQTYFSTHADHLALTVMDRVDEALAVKGMHNYLLAMRCGITSAYRYQWWGQQRKRILRGGYNPQFRTICRLAKALYVEPSDLIRPFPEKQTAAA